MVVIFGWGSGRAKDLGEVAPTTCPNCHNEVFLHEVKSDKQFSLYFVPIASYGGDQYLVCPTCQHGLQIRPDQRIAVDNMRAATASFRRGRVPDAYYQQTVEHFWASLGVDGTGRRVLGTPASVPPTAAGRSGPAAADGGDTGGPTLAEQLKGLGELREQGVLTEREFAAAKKRLIDH